MGKLQIIKCKTCDTPFAVCTTESVDADWYKKCIRHLKTDNAIIYSDDSVDLSQHLNDCCGKKFKIK